MTIILKDNAHYQMLTFAFMVACSVSIFTIAILNPIDVWDMLGYAASVHTLNGHGVNEIHATVFGDLKAHSTAIAFQELTVSSSYRQTMSTDPEAFSQQIPFYKIRLLYILLLDGFTKAGIGMYEAMHFLSAAFGSAGLLLIYVGLRNQVHSLFWVMMPFVFYGVTSDLSTLQHGGVDTFAFFWLALTVIFYVRGSKLLLPTLALCVLVRTDLIVHAALMFAVLLLIDRNNWKQIIVFGVLTLVMYFAVNTWAGNFGWAALIHFVFVSDMSATHPAIYSQYKSFDVNDYLGFLASAHHWVSKWLWLSVAFAGLSTVTYFGFHKKLKTQLTMDEFLSLQRLNIVCIISVAYVFFHYLLYPAIFMRFFIGSCIFMVIAMFSTISYILQGRSLPGCTHKQ